MYRFSQAIYRELCAGILEDSPEQPYLNHERVLRACEAAVERLATDRHYFARPARTLFTDIRAYFPISAQGRVWRIVERYMTFADEFLSNLPQSRFDIYGNPTSTLAIAPGESAASFVYEEHIAHSADYLWGSATYAFAVRLADSFAQSRTYVGLVGAHEDIPAALDTHPSLGPSYKKPPVEIVLSRRLEFG